MRILILHRVPFAYIKYDRVIDHAAHDVVYVGKREALSTIPEGLRCSRVERAGTGTLAEEVIAIFAPGVEPFDRVISMSQYEVMDAARVREALGVQGSTLADVLRTDDKVAMKRDVHAKQLRAPRFLPCREATIGQAPWEGRTVLKPVDGTASRNVHVFATFAAAQQAIADGAVPEFDADRFEVEEFLEGPIYHCDGLMLEGEPLVILASRYVGTCLDYAHGQPLGSVQLPEDSAACAATLRYLDAVGLRSGPFHLELIETRGATADTAPEFAFLEVAARSGGSDIVELFELATGIDLVSAELAVQIITSPHESDPAMAWLVPRAAEERTRAFGFLIYPGHALGAAHARIEGADAFKGHPGIVKWKVLAPGAPLATKVSYFDFELPLDVILTGSTSAEVGALIHQILASVRIVPVSDLVPEAISPMVHASGTTSEKVSP